VISLLRYPGGKSRAISQLQRFVPETITEICSPFFGGGSFEIHLANRGVIVNGYDAFPPLVTFWQHALSNPEELAAEIERHYPRNTCDV
jgi:DNA adenine methylase